MNEQTTTQTVTPAKPKREVQTFDFADQQNVRIPAKMTCTCCGAEIGGYAPKVAERVKKSYNDNWGEYVATFKCSKCKSAENMKIRAELNATKNAGKIEKAIKLLEENGYNVRKAEAAKPVIDEDIVTVEE